MTVQTYHLSVVIERGADGYYAYCPQLQDCYTRGDTYEEALRNIRDAVRLHVEDRISLGEPMPDAEEVAVTTINVAI